MKNNNVNVELVLAVLTFTILVVALPELAHAARDFVGVAEAASNQAKSIARAGSLIGVLVGAILLSVPGCVRIGQGAIVSGVIGAAIAWGGADSIRSTLSAIFG